MNEFSAQFQNNPNTMPANYIWQLQSQGCDPPKAIEGLPGATSNQCSITWNFPGLVKIFLSADYMDMNGLPNPPRNTVSTAIFQVMPPNREILLGDDVKLTAIPGTTPFFFRYSFLDSASLARPITMDASTFAEEKLTYTIYNDMPVNMVTDWQAGGSPDFQFTIREVQDNKGILWDDPVAGAASFDAKRNGYVYAQYTQVNRIVYFDTCGEADDEEFSAKSFKDEKFANPNDPGGRYIKTTCGQ